MTHDAVAWFFRIMAAWLVLWTLFLVARRLLRRAGVIAYPPFGSQEEYLEAAVHMNLEDFIGRAKATPRQVTQKPSPPATHICGAKGCFCRPSDDLKITFGSVGTTAIGRNTVAVDLASLAIEKLEKFSSAPFRVGQWIRIRRHPPNLGEVIHSDQQVVTCRIFGGDVASYLVTEAEPAYPKSGEWWRWTGTKTTSGRLPHKNLPFLWLAGADRSMVPDVERGWCVPVNYGEGEKKSGVA